jgi:hypothetical protein
MRCAALPSGPNNITVNGSAGISWAGRPLGERGRKRPRRLYFCTLYIETAAIFLHTIYRNGGYMSAYYLWKYMHTSGQGCGGDAAGTRRARLPRWIGSALCGRELVRQDHAVGLAHDLRVLAGVLTGVLTRVLTGTLARVITGIFMTVPPGYSRGTPGGTLRYSREHARVVARGTLRPRAEASSPYAVPRRTNRARNACTGSSENKHTNTQTHKHTNERTNTQT